MKFGGSSLVDAAKIKNVARTVERFSKENSIVVVASALNDVTDKLVEIGELAQKGKIAQARTRLSGLQSFHLKTARGVIGTAHVKELAETIERLNHELERTVEGVSHLRELTPRSRDYLLSFGERLSTPILTLAMRNLGLKARNFTGADAGITTDENF